MIILGLIFIACLIAYFTGICVSPDHEFGGWPAVISFIGMCSSGLALAVQAL